MPGAAPPAGPGRLADTVAHLLALVLGVAVGVAGSLWQAYGVPATVASLLLLAVAVLGGGLGAASRLGALLVGAGSLVTALVASGKRPEGDLLVPATWHGYLWLAGGLVLLVAGVVPDYRRLSSSAQGAR